MNHNKTGLTNFTSNTTLIKNLLSLHDEYLEEYDHLASRLMENIETHDTFMNWLGARDDIKMQEVLESLMDKGYAIALPHATSIIVGEDQNPLLIN